ncbi:hypothetical protein [Nitrospirillum amazonense]|uniref:hypothetical protein n=1 Tax=Nitrospirillum amazonense TaxID=28077 RepID=UPI0011A40A45|nr:hypothetical protein [Nitrospirillum amazonense]
MIPLTRRAAQHVADLRDHYEELGRAEAVRNLYAALERASDAILAGTAIGLTAPRSYPILARRGWLWVKSGRYWIAFRHLPRPAILAVFHEMADIPGRL